MKIVFFGTSHGVPEPNRRCSSAMIEVGDSRYFIDMGMQSIEELRTRAIPIESVKCIFVTHMHGDHTNGLISFIDICSWMFMKPEPIIYLPGDTNRAREAIASWIACNGVKMRDLEFRHVEPGALYEDERIKVTAFKTTHTSNSHCYLVEAEGKRVFFSGDMSYKDPVADFPVSIFEKPVDLVICESAHFAATAMLPVFEGNKNLRRLCFNHYSDKYLASVLETVKLLSDIPVTIATDNMEITL